jgi:outer membrane usher protein
VPNLLSYYGNKLGISDKDIPLNYTIDATEKIIAPPFRGGAVVAFPVQRVQRIVGIVTLHNNGVVTIPAFGQLMISTKDGKRFESPIGKQGEFYLESLPAGRHVALVEYKEQKCNLVLEVPDLDESEIKLGKLSCQLH